MYQILTSNGSTVYRTDLYSRCQLGSGSFDPKGTPYSGRRFDLDGRVSCSVVVDTDLVSKRCETARLPIDPNDFMPAPDFWKDEFIDTSRFPAESKIWSFMNSTLLRSGSATPDRGRLRTPSSFWTLTCYPWG